MELGKTISNLRKQNKMTQEELANRLGVSPQAVSKWENNSSCPDISLLPDLAEIFDITVDELLSRNMNLYNNSSAGSNENNEKSDAAAYYSNRATKIHIVVERNHAKAVNVTLPINVVNFGLSIGGIFTGIDKEQQNKIMTAIDNGLLGEIVNIDTENGEHIRIILE